MDGSWHVVLRDVLVILAAGSVVTAAVFTMLVLWQLYRLAIELQDEAAPIVDAMRITAETVQDTASFVRSNAVPPAISATGFSIGAVRTYRELSRFFKGLRRDDSPRARLEG